MIKLFLKKSGTFILIFVLLFSFEVKAEGQKGLSNIINFGYYFMVVTNILVYTIIGGFIIKSLFFRDELKIEHRNIKSFALSLVITIMLTIIFKDKFTFLIYNML
mgnify:CR=1 FL=1